jgi:hypothetical protein
VILTPRHKSWREYLGRASRFTDDFPDIKDHPAQEPESLLMPALHAGREHLHLSDQAERGGGAPPARKDPAAGYRYLRHHRVTAMDRGDEAATTAA